MEIERERVADAIIKGTSHPHDQWSHLPCVKRASKVMGKWFGLHDQRTDYLVVYYK